MVAGRFSTTATAVTRPLMLPGPKGRSAEGVGNCGAAIRLGVGRTREENEGETEGEKAKDVY